MANMVAIIGRTNVGKSTLFNRLVGQRASIVDDMPGVTRDRHYDIAEWGGKTFTIIDTGGYTQSKPNEMTTQIQTQILIATEEADQILFVVDCKVGVQPEDITLADILRKRNKPIVVAANKADSHLLASNAASFYSFGFEHVYPVSAIHGSGTGDLLDAIIAQMPTEPESRSKEHMPKIAIVGRPNAGKSTLINNLLGKNRNIVDSKPHTTRTPTYSHYRFYNKECILVDTAGISPKQKTNAHSIEFYALIRSIKAIEQADICMMLIDAREGLTTQDVHIMNLVQRKKKGLVLLVNKWDLIEKDSQTALHYQHMLQEKIGYMKHIPIVFISGYYKKNIYRAMELALSVYSNKGKHLTTAVVNRIIQKAVMRQAPPMAGGKSVKINYATQLKAQSPTFVIFCNHPQAVATNYKRYLEKQIRAYTDFDGLPITIFFRQK